MDMIYGILCSLYIAGFSLLFAAIYLWLYGGGK